MKYLSCEICNDITNTFDFIGIFQNYINYEGTPLHAKNGTKCESFRESQIYNSQT